MVAALVSSILSAAPVMPPTRQTSVAVRKDSIPREIWCCRKSDTNTCKCSLIVSCAVDTQQLCWNRRHYARCDCLLRELPVCLKTTPHGCPVWREGHQCSCPREELPCCFVTGCHDRREGRRCDCPRRPATICEHVRAAIRKYLALTTLEAARLGDLWAEYLWATKNEEYADREPGVGFKTETAAEAVAVMTLRESLGLSLWHRDDDRGEDSIRRLKRVANGLKLLFGAVQKGGAL